MRMTFENHSEHVPDFALVPVGRGPDTGDCRQRRSIALERHLDPYVAVAVEGKQVINHRVIAFGLT